MPGFIPDLNKSNDFYTSMAAHFKVGQLYKLPYQWRIFWFYS